MNDAHDWEDKPADEMAQMFAAEKVDFVPDPMVLRAAELFLLGKDGAADAGIGENAGPDAVWDVIDRNLDGILAFFHLLMTRERIPLIDYEITFPGTRITELLGERAVPVHPDRAMYDRIKGEAKRKLGNLRLDDLPNQMLDDIQTELGAVGYEWFPDPGLDLPENQRVAATFAMGGMIFGGYAQATGTDHVLQTTRSRLFAELTVPQDEEPIWGFQKEAELFDGLRKYVAVDERFVVDNISLPPTVIPLLLREKPSHPKELVERALALRDENAGQAYRRWHASLRDAWSLGRHDAEAEAVVDDVYHELDARFGERERGGPITATTLDLELEAGVKAGGGELPTEAKASAKLSKEVVLGVPDRLRNWVVENLAFRRHRKLLLRMSLEQRLYDNLTHGLKNLWMLRSA